MNAEDDAVQALTAVEKLAAAATHQTGLTIKIPASRPLAQLSGVEQQLEDSIRTLKDLNCIIGTPMTLDKILIPREEAEIGQPMYQFEGGDATIVAEVQHQMVVDVVR